MRDKIELTGIILSSMPVGDYDKRIVILTKERGKITAFARGARKPNSPYLGISEPFNFGVFTLSEGYDAYHLAGADIKEYFLDVKNDIEGICYATYFCDILEYLCVDGYGDTNVLNLIYITLKSLTKSDVSKKLIRRIFELKILDYDGVGFDASHCMKCNCDKLEAFYLPGNGFLCEKCAVQIENVKYVSQTAIYTLQYILSAPLKKLYTFQVNEEIYLEIESIIDGYFKKHVNKNFKSLEILSVMC
ncbi:MAG: DNA repair protein RecO [Lachnospiraceae bacterium]